MFDIQAVTRIKKCHGCFPRRSALHLSGNQSTFEILGVRTQEERRIRESLCLVPRGVWKQQPVSLDEDDVARHAQRVFPHIMLLAIVDGPERVSMLEFVQLREKMVRIERLRTSLDALHQDFFSVSSDRMALEVVAVIVKAVKSDGLDGMEPYAFLR